MKSHHIVYIIFCIVLIAINSFILFILLLLGSGTLATPDYYYNKRFFEKIECVVEDFYIDEERLTVGLVLDHNNMNFDKYFIIQAKNYEILEDKGFLELLDKGLEIEIVSAPGYFGDGWNYPIVEIKIDNVTYLDFTVGFENNLEYYKESKQSLQSLLLIFTSTLILWVTIIVIIYKKTYYLSFKNYDTYYR